MAACKPDINQLINRFEQDISHYPYGYNETNIEGFLQAQMDILKKDIPVEDAARFSKKVLWRLVNSLIRNTGRNPGRVRLCRSLLNNNFRYFRLDIATKCTALNKMKKFAVNPGEQLEEYLAHKTANDVVPAAPKSKIVYAPENYREQIRRQLSGEDAVLFAPKAFAYVDSQFKQNSSMDLPVFTQNVDLLLAAAEKSSFEDKFVHFSNLYKFMQKKAQEQPNTAPRNLFDDTIPEADTIHKRCVQSLALIYARRLYQARDLKNVSRVYTTKFSNLLTAVVRKNSFTRDEVKDIARRLQSQPWTSRSVDAHVSRLGADLVDVFDKKQADEIRKLNYWVYDNRRKDALEFQAVSDVYVSQLYKKLIDGQDIGADNLNRRYNIKKNLLKSEVCALYGTADEQGNIFDSGAALQQVIKRHREDSRDKTCMITNYLEKKCRKCGFYSEVNYILRDFKLTSQPAPAMSLNNRYFPELDH